MSRPCDTGICQPLICPEYDDCLIEALSEPSVGSIHYTPSNEEEEVLVR